MMFKLFVIFVLSLSFSVAAQSPSKILKNAEKALGGSRAFQTAVSWSEIGTVTRVSDGASGRFFSQTSRPNLYNIEFELNGFEVETGYNGRSGWVRDSRDGLKTLTGDASVDFQAEAAYRNSLWLNYKNEKSKIVVGGKGEVGGKPANILILNTSKGVTIKLFFDAVTNLPLREEFSSGDVKKTLDYSDYRLVKGLNRPYAIRLQIDGESFDIKLSDVKANQPIAKSEFDFPQISGEPLPEIQTLLKELQANEDKVENILDTYSFVQKSTRRELGKDGVLREKESETFQLSFYKGNRIRRLIEKNGKPLSAKDQENEDKDAQKQVEEIEKEIAKKEAKPNSGPPRENGPRVSIAEVLRASNLINPRRERFRGRDVIVFDFEPNPNFDYKNAKSMLKFFGKTAGVMWIDEKDKQVARIEAVLFDSYKIGGGVLAKLKKGASFTLEQERVNNEIWLPSVADINLSIRVLLVRGIDVNQIVRSYDYRKFATEVKEAKVDETKNP